MSDMLLQNDGESSQIRIRVIAGKSLAKKDIFGASDPYVRIDLNTINGDVNIDSVLTKTKKKVSSTSLGIFSLLSIIINHSFVIFRH